MFSDRRAYNSFAGPDLDALRTFYGDTLGVRTEVLDPPGILVLHLAGGNDTMVYPKDDHEPANFTVLNFTVDDVDAAVDALVERGVTMERYEGFDHDEKGIVDMGGMRGAWFTDPAGNIIAVMKDDLIG